MAGTCGRMTEPHTGDIPEAIHDAAGDWLNKLEAGADPETARAFRTWEEADPRHKIAFEKIKKDWQLGKLLDQREIGRNRALPRAPFWMRHRTHVAAATLGTAALLGVVTVDLVRPGGPLAISTSAQAATYETAVGEIRTINLADGSSVILDTATRLRVQLLAGDRRLDLEQGRARFHVAADKKRPFRVVVVDGEVLARSTLFDVNLIGARPVVTVLEGTVELHGPNVGGDQTRVLAAGRSQALNGDAMQEAASQAEARWVSGMLALDATPLAEAVAAINRYNQVKLQLAEPFPAQIRVTGAYRVRDPDAFARALAASFHLKVQRPDSTTILLLAPARKASATK